MKPIELINTYNNNLTMDSNLAVIIMAGGLGKRMESSLPKVLHEVNGEPMIVRTINSVLYLNPAKIVVVVGNNKDLIKTGIEKFISTNIIEYALQNEPLGTGHAVQCAMKCFNDENDNTDILILCGDTPLLSGETLLTLYDEYKIFSPSMQITGAYNEKPDGYGRISFNPLCGTFRRIIEHKDCNDEELKNILVHCSIYLSKLGVLNRNIPLIKNNNVKSEYYLTDVVELINQESSNVRVSVLPEHKLIEITNVNTRKELETVNSMFA